jgi:nicotinate-nucleotide adenylyltransferase
VKTGLFFGSFNPIHVGHLIIGSHLIDFTDLSEVWYIVSPHNPLKDKASLLNEYERLEMVRIATEDEPRLKASDIEFTLSRPSYTIHTLLHLQEKYPNREWVLIMGADTVPTLPKWKNYEQLVNNYEIYIYPRPDYILDTASLPLKMKLIPDVPIMEISASHIRNAIRQKKSVRYMLTEKVFQYIDKWGLYLK